MIDEKKAAQKLAKNLIRHSLFDCVHSLFTGINHAKSQ